MPEVELNRRGRVRFAIASASALAIALTLGVTAPSVAEPAAPVTPLVKAAAALNGADFIPGNIISDALFYDRNAMTVAQIQAFLNSMHGPCTNGKCLNVLVVTSPARPASYSDTTGNLRCAAMNGGTMSAADLIYRAQVACGISAKVILATLQKEQGLITKTAPSDTALKHAMGMACPDTAPCATYAEGFANQIYLGTRQLITYKQSRFSKQPGLNTIGYHPNAACGATTFNIQNYATAALYAYTPYRPNAAALANLGGTGDSCSSYGNRNFWVYYSTWFGSTHGGTATVTADTTLGEPADYLLARDFGGTLWLYPGNGAGGLGARSQVGAGWDAMTIAFPAGDVNGDGKQDVLARDTAGGLWVFPRDGAGGWLPKVRIGSGWNQFENVWAAGDFNADGDPDVLAMEPGGALYLYRTTGSNGWEPRIKIGSGWHGFRLISSAGDFTGDGNVDVWAVDTAGKLWLYPGKGRLAGELNGFSARILVSSSWTGYTAIVGGADFNTDDKMDVLGRDSAGKLWFFPGNGAGGYGAATLVGDGWDVFSSVAPDIPIPPVVLPTPSDPLLTGPGVGDINGDTHADVLARDAAGALWLYPGNGTGGWLPRMAMPENWKGVSALLGVGDFDGDAHPDLVGRDLAGDLWLFPTDGTGGLLPKVKIGAGWNVYDAIFSAADFTGDGEPDLMARDRSGGLFLYPATGTGGWGTISRIGAGWNAFSSITGVGDFNGDLRADVLAGDPSGNLWLYPGDEGSTWKPRVKVGAGWSVYNRILSPGDFTGDDKMDVLARNADGGLWLYPGSGSGGWGTPTKIGGGWHSFNWIG